MSANKVYIFFSVTVWDYYYYFAWFVDIFFFQLTNDYQSMFNVNNGN